ncbi:MvdC/MvdD family ATP grasp protein [Acuticoccus yangtzensis]|uniref:MvdC/MvdD family ATP grasp protein n=1 Tax=Acuticoccus yangtzensis TaxID=1443441 RepID=UPI001300A6FD|nr:hypothetical protein [Acuticoccus yangtzensis]
MLLIWTCEFDTHADFIVEQLEKRGHLDRVFRFNTDDWPSKFDLTSTHSESFILDKKTEKRLDIKDVDAFWYRRPQRARQALAGVDLPLNEIEKDHIYFSSDEFVDGIMSELPEHVLSINHPDAVRKWSNKIRQMKQLARCGIKVPESIVTNNGRVASDFSSQKASCIKPLNFSAFIRNNMSCPLWTRKILEGELEGIENLCPSIIQEWIEADFEARVVVIGNNVFIFVISIDAGYDGSTDDIRTVPEEFRSYRIISSTSIETTAIFACRCLSLNFASMDVLVKGSDVYVIDINPIGQWLWLQHAIDVDMSSVFCDFIEKSFR